MEKVEYDYKCVICQEVMSDPYTILTCNHTYCSQCIQDYITAANGAKQVLKYFRLRIS